MIAGSPGSQRVLERYPAAAANPTKKSAKPVAGPSRLFFSNAFRRRRFPVK
jgi:hypothetical protein